MQQIIPQVIKNKNNLYFIIFIFYKFIILHLWTFKSPTASAFISHKVTVSKVILNDRWCKEQPI
jgi:hypothetical protein